MDRVRFSLRRLVFIALNTLREAARQKAFHFLFLLAVVLIAGAHALRDLHFGSPELKFLADLGFGVIGIFGAVLAIGATAQLFFSEIERRTVLTLLAKPVWRAEFVLGKFAGVAVLTAMFCGGLTILLVAVIWTRESALLTEWPGNFGGGRVINYAHLAAVGLLQWLKLLVLAALTLLVASYARTQLFTLTLGFLLFGLCHLQHFAVAAASRPGVSATGTATGWVARALPDFQLFNLVETNGGAGLVPWSDVRRVVTYALAYVIVACGLAIACFQRREI